MSSIGSIGAGTNALSMISMMRMRPPPGGGDSSSSTSTTTSSSTTPSAPPSGMPPPPKEFSVDMSTTQFAQSSSLSGTDSDGDGSISKDEFGYDDADELGQKLFDSIDEDDDGSLSSDEVSAYQDMMAQAMQQEMSGMMGMSGPPPGPPPSEEDDPIASLDSDGDGSVSSEEFGITSDSTDEMKALFSAIDTDGDDSLSSDEISAFKEKMSEAMQSQSQDGMPPPPGGSQDVSAFLEQLAKQYASLSSSTSDSSVSLTA